MLNASLLETLEFTTSPKETDITFLTQRILENTPAYGNCTPFGFWLRDSAQELIAGCNGVLLFHNIYTDQLWVHQDYRKMGLGKALMERVHTYARAQGCKFATVNTMSFQGALPFYEKLGYQTDFRRAGYAHNSTLICLKKEL